MIIATSEGLWAEHGLTGLVLFALFGLVTTMLGLFMRAMKRKDDDQKSFLTTVMEEDRKSREAERNERRETRESHDKNTEKLSNAIEGLTLELQKENEADLRIKTQVELLAGSVVDKLQHMNAHVEILPEVQETLGAIEEKIEGLVDGTATDC